MATLTSGDTLSLNGLAAATGQTTKSISAAKGNTTGPIAMSSFGSGDIDSISGFTYIAEDTSENYSLSFIDSGANFNRISERAANFSWEVQIGSYITINTNSGKTASFDVSSMSATDITLPSGSTKLLSQQEHTIRAKFADGFNQHISYYDAWYYKTIYAVDSYDGNTVDLCLTLDTPIQLSDGTFIQAGELEEGMVLKGSNFDGLESFQDSNYINWTTNTLFPREENVVVQNLVYGFAEKIYNFNNNLVKSTMEHPFLVKDENGFYRFKRAHLITTSDFFIQNIDGIYIEVPVESIDIEMEPTEIVTIDVDGSNIYFANNIVSHNKDQGNTHSDFVAPSFATLTPLSYDSETQILSWTAATGVDADSVSGLVGYQIQLSATDSFPTVHLTKSFPSDITEWQLHYNQIQGVSPRPAGTYETSFYYRIRAIANGGLASGWYTYRVGGTITLIETSDVCGAVS